MSERIRRNGQLSSCEPCRKSKLRCDHARPCSRCVRRRLTREQCYYHPAPMSRLRTPAITPDHTPPVPSPIQLWPSPLASETDRYEAINVDRSLVHFADPDTLHSQRPYASLTRTGVARPRAVPPDRRMVSEGAELLKDILDLVYEIGEPLLDPVADEIDICVSYRVLAAAVWKATRAALRALLNDRSDAALERVSQMISEQSSQPPVYPPTTADGTLDAAFAPHALRWETVGMYCALIGVFLGGEKDKDVNFLANRSWKSSRKTLMHKMFQICARCESLCDRSGAVSDLMLWYLLIYTLFATWCYGDDSYHVIRLLGNTTSVFLALGYDKGAQEDRSTPMYILQLRKRAIAWAHENDKVFATFTSRPPRLSHHFCFLDLPLDIADSVLTGPTGALQEACASLDHCGWSREAVCHPVSWWRMVLLLCPFREKALELKNGPSTENLVPTTRCALRDLSSTWQSIPSHIRYDTAPLSTYENGVVLATRGTYSDYLYTQFLLLNLLVNAGEPEQERLIATAREILHLVLLPARNRDTLYARRSDFEWTLVFYAMPCASVLVLELLRQAQHPDAHPIIKDRSEIVQDVSVLIYCCEAMTEPEQNNYQICKQAQTIFSRSLDSILNTATGPVAGHASISQSSVTSTDPTSVSTSTDLEDVGALYQNDLSDWTDWLEMVGVQADPWMDSFVNSNQAILHAEHGEI